MPKVVLEKMSSTDLDKAIGGTIFGKKKSIMDKYIMDNFKEGGDNFFIPTVEVLVNTNSSLKKNLLDLYDRKFPTSNTSDIDEKIKILQASVFDGLVFGANVEKDLELQIYTANMSAIFTTKSESKFSLEKTLDLNRQGIVNAVRIDVEYTSEEGFTFKQVSLNKNTNLKIVNAETGEGKFFLIPYIAVVRSMAFFKEMLNDGRTLCVTQDAGSLKKVRYVSARKETLAKYCDSEEFASSLKPEYFPLKAFMYIPVLGAGSLTIGRTRIDMLKISRVDLVDKPKVEKAESGSSSLITEFSIQKILSGIYNSDIGEYADLVSKLPKKDLYFGSEMSDAPTPLEISKYYHQLSASDRLRVNSLIPGLNNEIAEKQGILTECVKVDTFNLTEDSLKQKLQTGIYKFIIRKKDCKYSTLLVTNSQSILEKVYGKDYFKKYESFGVRLYKAENMILNGAEIESALEYCGFPYDDEIVSKVARILNTEHPKQSNHEMLADLFKSNDSVRKPIKRSSTGNEILARRCFEWVFNSGSFNYYGSVDLNKVESMYKLG